MKVKLFRKDYIIATTKCLIKTNHLYLVDIYRRRESEEGKVNRAIKILAATDETFEVFLEKHPKAPNEILLDEEVQHVHAVIYDRINSNMVREAIKKTRSSAGPSGLVAAAVAEF